MSKEEGGKGKPTTNFMQAQMYLKTWDAPAYILLSQGKDMVMPGEDAKIEFLLRKPMVGVKRAVVSSRQFSDWIIKCYEVCI